MDDRILSLKTQVSNHTDELIDVFENISDYLFRHPELSGEEFNSSKYISDLLNSFNFSVSFPYDDLPTAFVATYGNDSDRKTFAFVAEYDALPGYGQDGSPGHACGHNWIAASMCGCGIVLSKIAEELSVNIKVIGTPAEETFGAKYDMIKKGAFEGVDFAMQAHLDASNCVETVTLAMNSLEFDFTGVPAHAAQFPEKGINALDAVISMFNSVGAMRQQLDKDARIHGIITNGGTATNVIPDFAQCRFTIRAPEKKYLSDMRRRLLNIAEGAALSTGAQVKWRDIENPFDNMVNLKSFGRVVIDNFSALNVGNFVPREEYPAAGSSDIGNVSHVCPTLYAELSLAPEAQFYVHDESAMLLANSEIAYRKMEQTIKAYCCSVIDIASNPGLAEEITDEFLSLAEAEHRS